MFYPNTSAKEYLRAKNIEFSETNGELVLKCVFGDCDYDSSETEAHLWMNAETGLYHCKKCQTQGNLITLAKHFGDRIGDVNQIKPVEQKPKKVFNPEIVDVCNKRLPIEIRQYLNNRGITDEMIEEYKLGWWLSPNGENRISIPVKNKAGEYEYLKLRKDPRDISKGSKYIFYPAGSSSNLFGAADLENLKDHVFVCEGEFDCMLLRSKGEMAVSSTAGAGTFKTEWVKEFEHIKEVYIVYDNDAEGAAGAKMVAEKLSVIKDLAIFIITLPDEVGNKGDITDYFMKANGTMEGLLELAQPFVREKSVQKVEDSEGDNNQRQIDLLKEQIYSDNKVEVFLDQLEEAYVRIPVNGYKRNVRCGSEIFRRWLVKNYWDKNKEIPNSENIKKVISLLEAEATFGGKTFELHSRIAMKDGAIWYDLGNESWQAVRIDENGWEIVDDVPILFKRSFVQNEQVAPQQGGDIMNLLKFVPIKDENQKILFLASTIANFIPGIARPIQMYQGPQGSAKSTTCRINKDITDPAKINLITLNGEIRELAQQMDQHYLLVFDNISFLSTEVSDALCRAVTGGGFSKRKLYSDSDNTIFTFKRAIILNGINAVGNKADLLDRSVMFKFERIDEANRKAEEEFWNEFEEEKPKILGAIFDTLSKTLKILPTLNLKHMPRMADFSKWACAVTEALGYEKEMFLEAYRENMGLQNEHVIEENPVAFTLIRLVDTVSAVWEGTSGELLKELKKIAENEEIEIKSKSFPKSPSALSRRINEVKINLLAEGVRVEKSTQREWRIENVGKCRQSRDAVEIALNETEMDYDNYNAALVDNGNEEKHEITGQMSF